MYQWGQNQTTMLSKLQTGKFFNRLVEKAYINMMPPSSTLIVPIMLQFCGLVGLMGYLAFQNGQKAVTELTTQLASEICDRIEQHLDQYLTTPQQINQVTSDVMQLGLLNLSDLETTKQYLWQQMRDFNIGYNNFANSQGEFIGIERLDNGNLLIKEVSRKKGIGKLYVYTTDQQGNRSYLKEVQNYDPRRESWYINAVNLAQPVRSKIYRWENKPQILSLSSSYPLYDRTNKLVGVIDINLILSKISQFLASLKVGDRGRTFILERSGLIVASSTPQGQAKKLQVLESQDSLIQDSLIKLTTQFLRKRFGSLGFLVGKQQMSFIANETRYFVKVKNWRDELGLDWLIVVVIAEADLIKPTHLNNPTNIFLYLAVFLIVTQFGILSARWVIKLIMEFSERSLGNQVNYGIE